MMLKANNTLVKTKQENLFPISEKRKQNDKLLGNKKPKITEKTVAPLTSLMCAVQHLFTSIRFISDCYVQSTVITGI